MIYVLAIHEIFNVKVLTIHSRFLILQKWTLKNYVHIATIFIARFLKKLLQKVCMYKRESASNKANEGTDSKKVPLV